MQVATDSCVIMVANVNTFNSALKEKLAEGGWTLLGGVQFQVINGINYKVQQLVRYMPNELI